MATLYYLPHSPWSERARWALDTCGIDREERVYVSRFGAPWLRLKLRRFAKPITMPLMLVHGQVLDDSLDIARWADARASAGLFPDAHAAEVAAWHGLADRVLAAGRRRTTRLVRADPAAIKATAAKTLPGGGLLPGFVLQETADWLLAKYAHLEEDTDDEAILVEGLERLTAAIADGEYLVGGQRTWADIAMATGLGFIDPHPSMQPHVPAAALPHWRAPALAERFPEALAWRDRIWATRSA
ncbi:MAG: glutathione S-transferase family protein [Deltaproteobacteria bacterium]|nr:MAG: glutathione S-transferase family protein [Deltaproteobacteria bacterium]